MGMEVSPMEASDLRSSAREQGVWSNTGEVTEKRRGEEERTKRNIS
jgi:hypothetical protein